VRFADPTYVSSVRGAFGRALQVHQQNMMQDTVRTGAYQAAILSNASDFEGKVVMDVGTGSGILAYFAVKAGARKVYAIEASNVADRAARLLAANGLSDRITVIKSKVEEVVLPEGEKVDVIISEPMGFMLIHERMLESYIIARQMFLKPGGRMFPTTGTIFAAPFTDASEWARQLHRDGCEQCCAGVCCDACQITVPRGSQLCICRIRHLRGGTTLSSHIRPTLKIPFVMACSLLQPCGKSKSTKSRSGITRTSTGSISAAWRMRRPPTTSRNRSWATWSPRACSRRGRQPG
jgi:precorrin-6B methylase 2